MGDRVPETVSQHRLDVHLQGARERGVAEQQGHQRVRALGVNVSLPVNSPASTRASRSLDVTPHAASTARGVDRQIFVANRRLRVGSNSRSWKDCSSGLPTVATFRIVGAIDVAPPCDDFGDLEREAGGECLCDRDALQIDIGRERDQGPVEVEHRPGDAAPQADELHHPEELGRIEAGDRELVELAGQKIVGGPGDLDLVGSLDESRGDQGRELEVVDPGAAKQLGTLAIRVVQLGDPRLCCTPRARQQ